MSDFARPLHWPADPYLDGPYERTGKSCSKCGEWKALDEFRMNPRLKCWWDSWCNACHIESKRRWRQQNPTKVREYAESIRRPKTTRICPECSEPFEGWANQKICGERACKDRRYARLHPDEHREARRRHDARVRARAKAARDTAVQAEAIATLSKS